MPEQTSASNHPAAGYQSPPATGRFPKGQSGNPKGRPKGRRNLPNLLKDVINDPVTIRAGDQTRKVPSAEAMIRVQIAKAAKGDARALATVMKIIDMTGRSSELSEEERERRTQRWSRPLTPEEYDLVIAPAREKQRQKYRAMAESAEATDDYSAGDPLMRAIKSGDTLAAEGNTAEAIATYGGVLAACGGRLRRDQADIQAKVYLGRVVGRIGLLANELLFAGDFDVSVKYADHALTNAEEFEGIELPPRGPQVVPEKLSLTWIRVIRSEARMFLGGAEEARAFFCQLRSNKRDAFTSWESVILQDFIELREAGHSHPLMADIEAQFAADGWVP